MALSCDWFLELLRLAALCQARIGEEQDAADGCWPFVQPHPGAITIRVCGERPSCITSSRSIVFDMLQVSFCLCHTAESQIVYRTWYTKAGAVNSFST
ncbi:hypothetical protein QBC36DRAFT_340743 [Triangularia setosa]|uniref:Secreted protein n=1 Tax=Triangularia setosa TaxID=2587417 RepID=A0AAN6VWL3_9PEZI|nr:hypothetical protein QBC36DRAFT_340743 [Podospora setosa]